MEFTKGELEDFYRYSDNFVTNLEPTQACVVLKVFYSQVCLSGLSRGITLNMIRWFMKTLEGVLGISQ